MKLTINFVKGTVLNGEVIQRAEGWEEYSSDQIKQFFDGLTEGYKLRFNYPDKEQIVFESEQIESVTVHL